MNFPVGSVAHNLMLLTGVWHDRIELFELDGRPREHDTQGGTPGASPYENLVYIDFDGVELRQTNITFRGRPLHVRSFSSRIVDGILRFEKLGPNDPGHVGIAAGEGVLIFTPIIIDDSWMRYSEPDYIRITGDTRTRNTMLYRDGKLVRTMNVTGKLLTRDTSKRIDLDPRGSDGDVHEAPSTTQVFKS